MTDDRGEGQTEAAAKPMTVSAEAGTYALTVIAGGVFARPAASGRSAMP